MSVANELYQPTEAIGWLYRGVAGDHPRLAEARLGIVVPGDVDGVVGAQVHNEGNKADLAASPFTSWTARKYLAELHASQSPGGVVLRLPALPYTGDGWSWENSPDEFGEDEVLLRGIRMDAEVIG